MGESQGIYNFFEYRNQTPLSTFVEDKIQSSGLRLSKVEVGILDNFLKEKQVDYVDFLKIDVEGWDFKVMRGAREYLKKQKIGMIQFEYGGNWRYAGDTLASAIDYLQSFGYTVYILKSSGLHELDYVKYGEYYSFSNFVAVSPGYKEKVDGLIKGKI